MSFYTLRTAFSKFPRKRPLTYSYLRRLVESHACCSSTCNASPLSNIYIGPTSAGKQPILISSNSPATWSHSTTRHYATKSRVPVERKKVYRNPKLCYIWRPEVAHLIREKIWPGDTLREEKALILDSNAGPGVMTQELLESGVERLVSMDRNREFLTKLRSIRKNNPGRLLQAIHGDFYKMQYHGNTPSAPPVIRVKELFKHVTPANWESDVPIKVLGCFPHRTERTQAYLFASLMLERLSIFGYGRAQLNFFMTQSCYETITQKPGNYFKYRALSALYQVSSDVRLLHKEPMSSFMSPSGAKTVVEDESHLYLTQITPKQDIFVKHNLSQQQAFLFVYFVRQTLSTRSCKLKDVIEKWAPGHGDIVEDFGLKENINTGDVEGEILLRIFLRICQQDTFNGSWMGEDAMTYALKAIPTKTLVPKPS